MGADKPAHSSASASPSTGSASACTWIRPSYLTYPAPSANLRSNFHRRAAELLPAPQNGFYIANLRIAETGLDARSQLLKNGRFSTMGIYFNTNSAEIKAESAGVLQEIAAILNDNPTLGITIIGHTDSDGEDAHNLQLSKARAANVATGATGPRGATGNANVLSSTYGSTGRRLANMPNRPPCRYLRLMY